MIENPFMKQGHGNIFQHAYELLKFDLYVKYPSCIA